MRSIGALIYPKFELLDVFGPLELFGWRDDLFSLQLVGPSRGPVASSMGLAACADLAMTEQTRFDVLLIPGGWGPRTAVDTAPLLPWIAAAAAQAEYVLTVCTGSALLAASGFLDGRRATSNKAVFAWAKTHGPAVDWVAQARWVEDGKVFSSSGVSAGMDMALAAIRAMEGAAVAEDVALGCEYDWHRDSAWDPFAQRHRLT